MTYIRRIVSSFSLFSYLQQINIERSVYVIFVISCVSRMVMLGIPGMMGYDEIFSFSASNIPGPYEFIHGSWVERWMVLETYSYGRTLWTLGHLLFGYMFNATTNPSYPFTALCGIITLLFIAGIGRNLWGRKGMLLFMLFGALSPYMLNYTARSMGVMPAVMFLSAALFFLTLRTWSALQWILGGLCLGLSFVTHYGTGQTILAIGIGIALVIPIRLFERGISLSQKAFRHIYCPILGGITATLPIAILEGWSRYAGSSYLRRLLTHESVGRDAYAGPYGLWLRIAFEFEPIFLVLLVLLGTYVFKSRQFTQRTKIVLGMFGFVSAGLICNSLLIPYWRSHVVWCFLVSLAAVAITYRWPEKLMTLEETADAFENISKANRSATPFDATSLILAFIALACINTPLRTMSMMTRQVFCIWPMTALLIGTFIFWSWPKAWHGIMRLVIIVGGSFFAICWIAIYHAKAIQPREHMTDWNYPGRHAVTWLELILYDNGWERLRQRGNDNIDDVATTKYIYPALIYDEEYYMPRYLKAKLIYANADHLITPQNLVCGSIRFDLHQPGQLPPAYATIIPCDFEVLNSESRSIKPLMTDARGIELRFSGKRHSKHESYTVRLTLPADPGKTTQFGFQAVSISPYAPPDTKVSIDIRHQSKQLQNLIIPTSEIYQGHYPIYQCNILPNSMLETVELDVSLIHPNVGTKSPVSVFIRRPFIVRAFEFQNKQAISGVKSFIKADEIIDQEILTPEISTPMARSYFGHSGSGSITWESAPWSGDSAEVLTFILAYSAKVKMRLFVNDRPMAIMSQPNEWGVVYGKDDLIIRTRYFNGGAALNESCAIRLPNRFAAPGSILKFRLEIIESAQPNGWIGVRQVDDANLVLDNMNL